jgi:hypothetical protein
MNSDPILAQMRDALLTLLATLITVATPIVLVYLRSHFKIMQDAAMNQTVTASASRLAALLVSQVKAAGEPLSAVDTAHPAVGLLANQLTNSYPDFSYKLGITQNKAAGIILGEANKLITGAAPASPPIQETKHVAS